MSQDPCTGEQAGDLISKVPERSSTDHLLRILQQHHVQLSTMADTKASLIITVSSIVLTIALGRLNDPSFRLAVIVLSTFTMLALLCAILAVLPKFRRAKHHSGAVPADWNLLFFGHFSALDRQRWLDEMAVRMMPGRAYRTVLEDVYGLGCYLAQHKYPWLRVSYLFFLSGFVLASLVQLYTLWSSRG